LVSDTALFVFAISGNAFAAKKTFLHKKELPKLMNELGRSYYLLTENDRQDPVKKQNYIYIIAVSGTARALQFFSAVFHCRQARGKEFLPLRPLSTLKRKATFWRAETRKIETLPTPKRWQVFRAAKKR
jgi:hypothetical protein